MDMAFYYPRFRPSTHITTAGIPELTDAVALMDKTAAAPRWSSVSALCLEKGDGPGASAAQRDVSKSLTLLERGIDILNSAGGPSNPSMGQLLCPLYATRFELLNSPEHEPRCDYATRCHVQKSILQQAGQLIFYGNTWDETDLKQLDTACVIMAHFIKAFCALHPRPFHPSPSAASTPSSSASDTATVAMIKSKPSAVTTAGHTSGSADAAQGIFAAQQWTLPLAGSDVLTLEMVMARLTELTQCCAAACRTHGSQHPELRWLEPKLTLLKALLTIPLTGHLLHAQQYIDTATKQVHEFTQRSNLFLDGLKPRTQEAELGLYMLLQAEMAARIFNWCLPQGQVDGSVMEAYSDATEFYANPFNTAIEADGIMSEKNLHERRFETDAYACCLRSFASFLLGAPRPKATSTRDSPVFLSHQLFSLNPLTSVATSSHYIFSDVKETVELPLDLCRRRTGESLDRALQLNRRLYPEHRMNGSAAWTLLTMACMYADTRDYLYATGLFETASKAFAYTYGSASMERVFLLKLRYEFLAGVGSEQEAKTASHEVIQQLKQIDAMSVIR